MKMCKNALFRRIFCCCLSIQSSKYKAKKKVASCSKSQKLANKQDWEFQKIGENMQNHTKSHVLNLLISKIGNLKKFGKNMQNRTKSHVLNLLISKIGNF